MPQLKACYSHPAKSSILSAKQLRDADQSDDVCEQNVRELM